MGVYWVVRDNMVILTLAWSMHMSPLSGARLGHTHAAQHSRSEKASGSVHRDQRHQNPTGLGKDK